MFGNSDDNAGQPQDQPAQTNEPAAPAPTMDANPTPSAPAAPAGAGLTNDTVDYSAAQPASAPAMDSSVPASTTSPSQANEDELLGIKQQALQQLSPLVGHLDQTPEEEFRTTMMMIQASDDQSLVQKAYDAAQKIEDEKTKAQALLDIVNEINYFTQHHEGQESDNK